MKNRYLILVSFTIIIFLFTSCFKEEDIVVPPEPGDIETSIIVLGKDYENQAFYNFTGNSVEAENPIVDWDLAFDCKEDRFYVLLNSAKMMYAGNTYDTVFSNVTSSAGVDMIFDKSDGDMDSTAIGQWYYSEDDIFHSYNNIYIIDRGNGVNQQKLGEKKIGLDVVDNGYMIRYADLDGSNEHTVIIEKNTTYNFTYFSFDTGELTIAPPKDQWSLKFSRYLTMLTAGDDTQVPYLVTGVLLNPNGVVAALDTNDFFNICLSDTVFHEFSSGLDFIGYDWKYYDFDSGVYTMVPDKNFIVKNNDGFFYKLRFIDFYNDDGVKGTITMEVVKL